MHLKPLLLDMWLDTYEHDIEFNLAASTAPSWTVNEILSLANDEDRQQFLTHKAVYSRFAGGPQGLCAAIGEMQDVDVESVQAVTGASEALLVLVWLASEPGANVILPQPGFRTFSAPPESLVSTVKSWSARRRRRSINRLRCVPEGI